MAGVAPEVPRALAGRYRLVRLLAQGGMAEVWEGRDEVLSRPVAVKMLLSHLASDPFLRERFRREAVTAARLVHPGIVAIFDAGVEVLGDEGTTPGTLLSGRWSRDERQQAELAWPEQPSTAFIIMELVPGETLRDLIGRCGPLAPELAVAITTQVTEALAYAHAQGLVHRDIKPANVLLGREGDDVVRVKVADFGIAKAAATAHLDLTATGTLLGTPKYLSPEQVQGQEPDARADLYSLGVVLYEMLAGRAPFKGSTEMATALAHVQQEAPALSELRPGLPRSLYELVNALLVKDPAQRVPSALVLGGALTSVRRALGLPPGDTGSYIRLRTSAASGPDIEALPATGAAGTNGSSRSGTSATGPSVATGPSGTGPASPARGTPAAATEAGQPAGGGATVARVGPLPPPTASQRAVPAGAVDGGTVAFGAATQSAPGPLAAKPVPSSKRRDQKTRGKGRSTKARRHRTGRAASIVVAVLVLTGLLVLAELLHSGDGTAGANGAGGTSPGGATGTPGAPVSILSVHELAQDGNKPDDYPALLPNIISGQNGGWHGAKYLYPDFGRSGGFGLAFQLSGTRALQQLVITTTMQDWSAEVFVGEADYSTVGQWGKATSGGTGLDGSHTFNLAGRRGDWVLLWMLDPGPTRTAVVQHAVIN